MKTAIENSAAAAGGTRKKAASKRIVPESKIENTTMFKGVHFEGSGSFRCRVPEEAWRAPLERKSDGVRAAVVIVETAHVVMEITAKSRAVKDLEALCEKHASWRKRMSERIYSSLYDEIVKFRGIRESGRQIVPSRDFLELLERLDCYGSLQGFKTSRIAVSLELREWEELASLADSLGVKLEKLIRTALSDIVGKMAAFEYEKARGGIEFVKGAVR